MSQPRVHRLVAEPLSAERFAPFGLYGREPAGSPDWIASGSRVTGVQEELRGTGREVARLWRVGDLSFEGDTPYLGFVRYSHQGFHVAQLERHRLETQTWVALSGTGFLVVAPRSEDEGPPSPGAARAFLVEPGDVVSIGRGTWMCHFFPIRAQADYVVITARRNPEQDRDLLNFVETANTVLEIVLG